MSKKRKWVSPIDDGTYMSWGAMRRRCAGKDVNSRYYLGVAVCKAWENFDQFYRDMGPRPEGMTLDRKDCAKGYTPENCRWADRRTQVENRRNTIRLTARGKTLTLRGWADLLGVPYSRLQSRHKAGLSTNEVLSTGLRRAMSAPHGTTTKYANGCRCAECKSARSAWYVNYKERRDGKTA